MRQLLNINYNIPKKSLGQNFIIDKNFLNKIGQLVKTDIKTIIIEIGPGKGALTNILVKKKFKKLLLIEKDTQLSKVLEKKYINQSNINIINEDALKFDYNIFSKKQNIIIIGNLPYNISTQLLFKWLESIEWPPFYKKMVLMFQKEVADRILAGLNNKKYSRISVAAQTRCKITKALDAPAKIFSPRPKVDGRILEFLPIENYKEVNFFKLQEILNLSFGQRRKKIKTSLNKYINILEKLELDTNLRPENLTVTDYFKITQLL